MRTPEKPPGHLHVLHPNARAFESGGGCFATPGSLCKHYADTAPAKEHPQAPATILVGGKAKPPKPAKPFIGIKVHSKSAIEAQNSADPKGWVDMITKSPLPKHYRDHIKAKGGMLCIPTEFKEPKGEERTWFEDWKKAFSSDKFECTTGNLYITVNKPKPQPKGKAPPPSPPKAIRSEIRPDIGDDQLNDELLVRMDPTKNKLLHEWESPYDDGFGVHFGQTFPYPMKLEDPNRTGLIIICTRCTLKLGDNPERPFTCLPNEIVRTWFHEIACHAGPFAAGKELYGHGEEGSAADMTAIEVDVWFDEETTYKAVIGAIKGYWSSQP